MVTVNLSSKTEFSSPKILNFAKGRTCSVRIPGVCEPAKGTEIMAHPPKGASLGKGWGEKPPDYLVAICCHACHDVIDGRNVLPAQDYLGDYWSMIEVYYWRGMAETLILLHSHGLLTFNGEST